MNIVKSTDTHPSCANTKGKTSVRGPVHISNATCAIAVSISRLLVVKEIREANFIIYATTANMQKIVRKNPKPCILVHVTFFKSTSKKIWDPTENHIRNNTHSIYINELLQCPILNLHILSIVARTIKMTASPKNQT